MSEWKLVDVEGIGSGYACLTLDGVSTTKSRNLIQADRGAGAMVLVSPTWAPFSLITRIVTLPGLLASLVTRGESGKMLLEEVMFT